MSGSVVTSDTSFVRYIERVRDSCINNTTDKTRLFGECPSVGSIESPAITMVSGNTSSESSLCAVNEIKHQPCVCVCVCVCVCASMQITIIKLTTTALAPMVANGQMVSVV